MHLSTPFLFFFLIGHTFYAQIPTNIDSIKTIYYKNPEVLENISKVSQVYVSVNVDSAHHYAHILLKKCKKNDYDYQAKAINVFGHCHLVKNELNSALSDYEQAIALAEKGGLKFVKGVYSINLAQIHVNMGNIQKGILVYYEAERLLKKYNYENKANYYLADVYSGLGEAYNNLGIYDKALQNLFKSYKVSEKIQDYINMGITGSVIASVYKNMNELAKHEQYNKLSLKHIQKANYPLGESMVYYYLAENAYLLKNYKKSEKFLDSAQSILDSNKLIYSLGDIYNLYGHIFLAQKKYNQSEIFFNKGLEINRSSNMLLNTGNSFVGLGDLHKIYLIETKALNYYKQALELFTKENLLKERKDVLEKIIDLEIIIENKDSVRHYTNLYKIASSAHLNKEKQFAVIGQEIQYETSLKEAQIQSQAFEIEHQKSKNLKIIYGLSISVIFGLWSFFWYTNRQKQKELLSQNTLLNMQQNLNLMELQNLNQQLNPHEFKNLLIGIAPEIQEKAPEAYKNMVKLLNLTKESIGNKSLTESVQNQLTQIETYLSLEKNILSVPFQWELQNKIVDTSIEIPRLLLKNMVENALKHGIIPNENGGKISIKLYQNSEYLFIQIDDTGVGYNPNENKEAGIGISTYQKLFVTLNKKNKLNASLSIIPKEKGTTVSIEIPINYHYI